MILLATIFASISLPTIKVEASRLDSNKSEIAAHVDIISRTEIESSGAVSSVDLLEKRANLTFRKTNANPALAQVSMRGYGANGFGRVKIVVDGEELNNPDMTPQNLLRIPLAAIEKVEILHGPQTILHGSDASAGVINITSMPSDYKAHLGVEGSYGSFNTTQASINARAGDAENKVLCFADFDFSRSDGYRDNGEVETWSLKAGLKQFLGSYGSYWALSAFFADSRYGLPGGIMTGKSLGGIDYGDWRNHPRRADDLTSKAHNLVYGVNAAAKLDFDEENSINLALSYRKRYSKSYTTLKYDINNINAKLDYQNESSIGEFENSFIVGGDMKFDFLNTNANNFDCFTGAIFAREEFFLTDELSIFAGARSEWWRTTNRYRPSGKHELKVKSEVAGEVGANWRALDNLKLFTRWTRFYHAPLADEMISAYGFANLSLSPEYGHTTEFGIDFTPIKELNFNFTAHYTILEDEIAYFNSANVNLSGKNRKFGFDTSLVWSREHVGSAGILYSFIESEDLVPLVPRQQLRIFGEIWLTDFLAIGGGYRFVGEERYGGDFEGKGGMLPAYGIFDLNARLVPTWEYLKGWSLSITIDNLLDKRYCDYGEYFDPWYVYPAAGRSFLLTLRYEF